MKSVSHAFRQFVQHHDNLPAFHAGYLLLTFIAASMLSVGFFALLIVLHMAMDIAKYRARSHGARAAFEESLPDLALLSVALTAGLYLHESLAIVAGLSGLLRAELLIMRGLAVVLPKFLVALNVERVAFHPVHGHRVVSSVTQSVSSTALLMSILFIGCAPLILGVDWATVWELLLGQF